MNGDKRISKAIRRKVENAANTIYLSSASLWEIAIKISIGKLKLRSDLTDLELFLFEKRFQLLPFDYMDLETLLTLPFYHQDPFDRLIIAQSKTKGFEIITNDSQVKQYFVS